MKLIYLLLFIMLVNVSLFAQTALAPSAGDGSENEPYQIASLENLFWIAADNDLIPYPSQSLRWTYHYIQVANIDASETENWFDGAGWSPIGDDTNEYFSGTYNGQGFTIDGLYINRPDTNYIGLFGNMAAVISNLGLTDVDITGYNQVGGLSGANSGQILYCYSTGSVNATGNLVGGLSGHAISSTISDSYSSANVTGYNNVGGLVGQNRGYYAETMIFNCYSTGNVSGNGGVGGLVGQNYGQLSSANIFSCFFNGSVTGDIYVGGLVGYNYRGASIHISYNLGAVNGNEGVGGFAGANHYYSLIFHCYSTGSVSGNLDVGGFVGFNTTAVETCYWNTETSGQNDSAAGEGRTTADMTYPYNTNTYVNWDFVHNWGDDIDHTINNGYPYLYWQVTEVEPPIPPTSAHTPVPVHEATNVPVDTSIGWTYTTEDGYSDPDGFIINMWAGDLNEDPYQANIDGEAAVYIIHGHPFDFTYDETYYWQVIPYVIFENENLYAEDCPVWSFTTEGDVSIDEIDVPLVTGLIGNYPNPFNPETTIRFFLHQPDRVDLVVYNIRGQKIVTLLQDYCEAGEHSLVWKGIDETGREMSSGIYFYQMTTPDFHKTNKMLLLK